MTIIILGLLFGLIASIWLLPSITFTLGVAIILLSLASALCSILKRHRAAYQQGRITRPVFIQNVFFDTYGILIALCLAGLSGWYIAEIITRRITNDHTQLLAAILTGLLAGIVASLFIRRTWGRLIKTTM